jgi:DNA-binding transcriptional LysR family regulator
MAEIIDPQTKKRSLSILNVDLNLLVVLQALLEEKSVTHAAKRVCLSQSATSNALKRLRSVFEDQLLVRWSNKMSLTPLALELLVPVNQAIDSINAVLGGPPPFDPFLADSVINICASDYTSISLLPKLERKLQAQAPNITLRVSPLREPEALVRLEREDVSLVLGHFSRLPENLKSSKLFTENFVCMLRDGHPLLSEIIDGQLTLEQFSKYPHVVITREGVVGVDIIDSVLHEHGLERSTRIGVPHFLVAPSIIANSDMIAVDAERVTGIFGATYKITNVKLPPEYTTTTIPIFMLWDPRTENRPVLKWFRALLQEVAASL